MREAHKLKFLVKVINIILWMQNILDAEYSSILLLNAQSVNPSDKSLCKWKIPYISENFLHNIHTNIHILCISESWLKSYITDAQIHIKDYVPIRSDHSNRKGGGAILYIHEKIPISDEDHFDDITCQASFCILQTISTILINVYYPPKSSSKSFSNLLKHVKSYLRIPDIPLSDHRVVFINLLTDLKFQCSPSPIPTFEDHTFRSLNIHKADFIKMNSILSERGGHWWYKPWCIIDRPRHSCSYPQGMSSLYRKNPLNLRLFLKIWRFKV